MPTDQERKDANNRRKRKQRALDKSVKSRPYEKAYRATDEEHEVLRDTLDRMRGN